MVKPEIGEFNRYTLPVAPMQILETVYIEYRCKRCWNSNLGTMETVGCEADCRYCGKKNTVPDATLGSLERAKTLIENQPELLQPRASNPSVATEAYEFNFGDLDGTEQADRRITVRQRNYADYPDASKWVRLIGYFVDNLLLILSAWLGLQAVVWLSALGFGFENPINTIRRQEAPRFEVLLLLGAIPAALVAIQWMLLASSGQSLAKKLLMIRIVTDSGKVPGFLRAVVLRNWIPLLVSALPVVGACFRLIDPAFLVFNNRKCVHDYIAGTRVVTLNH